MNVNTQFPSRYLKASDLNGQTPIVTIDHVSIEQVGRQQDSLPVVYFAGKSKGVVLNKTNAKAIATIADSDETDNWTGVVVQLYSTMVEFQGESVEAIRMRAPKPVAKPVAVKSKGKAAPKAVEPDLGPDTDIVPDDEISF